MKTEADSQDIENGQGDVTAPQAANDPLPSLEQMKAKHYERIVCENKRVCEAFWAWKDADSEAKRLKKIHEGAVEALSNLINRDPAQRELPMGEGDKPLADDSWRDLELSVLEIPDGTLNKLYEADIENLGDLQDYWKAGKSLRDIKGIGDAADTAVKDAFSNYGAKHPAVFGEPAPQATESDDPQAGLKKEMSDEFAKRGILADA